METDRIVTEKNSVVNLKKQIKVLEKKLAWYKTFFENSSDAVFIVQPDTWEIVDSNEFASDLMGIPKTKLIGSNLPQFRRIFKLLKKSKSPVVLSELSLDTPDDFSIMVEVSARFVDYDGQNMIQAIVRDVSEQHALTDKLVQADKLVLLGQLTASISHEIRNPLAAVNLNLQVLQRKVQEETSEYVNIKTALQGVERISRIVEITLGFSRPTLPEIKNVNLNALIKLTLELLSTVLRKKEITIETNLMEGIPFVQADTNQIQQVLINLITNAVDAIDKKGIITLDTYLEPSSKNNRTDFIVVAITDTGIGIAPEDLPKIFNPFFTRKETGTGLGLPITQRILHQHRGIIDVESKVGIGTTFYIKLPIIGQ